MRAVIKRLFARKLPAAAPVPDPDPTAKPAAVLALAAIVKNEGPYLLEWLAHHRLLGIERFFIADNDSDDGSTDLLAALAAAGLITHIAFPGTPGTAPQLPAYRLILDRHGAAAEWFAFIDADEFIRPLQATVSLSDWLRGQPDRVGAVVLNWAVYGSAGRDRPGRGLVQRRFPLRFADQTRANLHYKTLLRRSAWQALSGNPHHFHLKPGWSHVDSAGAALVPGERPGKSPSVVWGAFRLEHYMFKSRAEFIHKKIARGRATRFDALRTEEMFEGAGNARLQDPADDAVIRAVKREMEAMRRLIADLDPQFRDMDKRIDDLGPTLPDATG